MATKRNHFIDHFGRDKSLFLVNLDFDKLLPEYILEPTSLASAKHFSLPFSISLASLYRFVSNVRFIERKSSNEKKCLLKLPLAKPEDSMASKYDQIESKQDACSSES